jgi:hypothetical protein
VALLCFRFLPQSLELGFLFVELSRVPLERRLLFGASAPGFQIFSLATLVIDDAVDIFSAVFHLFLELCRYGFFAR